VLTNATLPRCVAFVNYRCVVQIDTDQLVDLAETAALIGIDNPRGVSVYRRRYDEFPAPVIAKGRCVLWLRSDVLAWARETGRIP
jgi:predicted DNA-binding transcriptional regulator AlpA